jgi:REP element-mobilizing transposase RayT
MPTIKVHKFQNSGVYFITLTVRRWYYVLDRYNRWDILAKSLEYCRKSKGIKLYSFVFMINHIHLIIESDDLAGFLRDFKKHTSKEFKENIRISETSLIKLFLDDKGIYNFWEITNMPINLISQKFFLQKQNYIHLNPVRRNYVKKIEDWYWSSANEICELKVDVQDF